MACKLRLVLLGHLRSNTATAGRFGIATHRTGNTACKDKDGKIVIKDSDGKVVNKNGGTEQH